MVRLYRNVIADHEIVGIKIMSSHGDDQQGILILFALIADTIGQISRIAVKSVETIRVPFISVVITAKPLPIKHFSSNETAARLSNCNRFY